MNRASILMSIGSFCLLIVHGASTTPTTKLGWFTLVLAAVGTTCLSLASGAQPNNDQIASAKASAMKIAGPLLVLFGLGGFVTTNASCTPAQVAAVQSADDVIMAALPIVCSVATALDPTGATVVCAILNGAGEVVQVSTQALSSASVAAAVVAAHPATPDVAPKLVSAALAMKAARK